MSVVVKHKPFKTVVLDTGPIIDNSPSISTLNSLADKIITIPEVVDELVDQATQARFEAIWKPFVEFRRPKDESTRAFKELAWLASNAPDLSDTDIKAGALVLEIECGNQDEVDSFVKSAKERGPNVAAEVLSSINGAPAPTDAPRQASRAKPTITPNEHSSNTINDSSKTSSDNLAPAQPPPTLTDGWAAAVKAPIPMTRTPPAARIHDQPSDSQDQAQQAKPSVPPNHFLQQSADSSRVLKDDPRPRTHEDNVQTFAATLGKLDVADASDDDASSEDAGEEGWITPSNLDEKMAQDGSNVTEVPASEPIKVALATTDLRLQNVLVHHGLKLVGPGSMRRNIDSIRTTVLRCDGCFKVTENTSKQFCPSCGHPNLKRITATVDADGKRTLHLKKNYQFNLRGNRYSAPKPVSGTASGKGMQGGGKGNWGAKLILAEDQKEYLPDIDKGRMEAAWDEWAAEGRLPDSTSRRRLAPQKIGAGRNVNSKKRGGKK